MPKKVLHIINGEFYAGAERVQDLLASKLPKYGYVCEFFCLKDGVFPAARISQSSATHVVQMSSKFDISVLTALCQTLREGRFDLIHTHTVRGALIGRLASMWTRIPMVHHVHSPTRRDTEDALRNRINAFVEETLAQPGASHLMAVSDSLRDYLLEYGEKPQRITVIPNGVPAIDLLPEWHPPEQTWVIGVVALFRPRKGLEVLIRAMALLIAQGKQIRLRVIGGFETPEYEASIRALAAHEKVLESIDWIGFTKQVPKALASCDIFALPSLYGEGLPMVLIEAMAVGLPIVASDVEGIPQVISNQSVGVLVKPNDVDSLAQGLASIVSNPVAAAAMAAAGKQRQRDRFSDEAMAQSVAKIYDTALL